MNDPQENKLSMYLAVQGICNAHSTVWNGLAAFTAAFSDFEEVIEQIQATQTVQGSNITGIAADKQREKEEMITHTVRVAGAVYAYASTTGNHTLKARGSYSPSGLSRMRDTELQHRCQEIHNAANEHLANLGDYGIDAAMLAELQQEINDFAGILADPREAIVSRSAATGRLAEWFSEGDRILKERMDPLAEQFKGTGTFYPQYKGARIIVDLGG